MPDKVCTKCHVEKDRETGFHKDKSKPDGFRTWCKQCAIPASLAYHNRNKEHVTHRNRNYKVAHPARYLAWCARHRAKRDNVEFSITEQDIRMPTKCPILGIPLFMGGRHNPNSPSLDRINNERGYVKGNINVISYRANALKSDATVDELKRFSKWIVRQYGD
jgi:hypothetical protein